MSIRLPTTLSLKKTVAFVALAGTLAVLAAPAAAGDGVEVIGHNLPEAAYAVGVHDELVRTMHFPTGREASITQPQGTVSVWFVLSRDGKLVGRGIENSSNSMLLDAQAQQLVGRSRYEALPPAAWAGESTHRFVATYRFVRQPSGAPDASGSQVALR